MSQAYDHYGHFTKFDLIKLEEGVGIKVLSSLAPRREDLIAAAGITEARSTDPLEDVIDQWVKGPAVQSPTWENFFNVLDDLNLKDICGEIRSYFDDFSKWKHACSSIISSNPLPIFSRL